MPYSVWQAFVTDGGETVVQGATVTVYIEASGAPATLYDGPEGAAAANPQTSAVDGLVRFYVPAGVYKIEITKGALTKTFRHIAIGEAAGRDVGVAGGLAPLDVDSQVPAEHLLDYYTQAEVDDGLALKQDALVSGDNIKTVNGESLLGSGDLAIGLLYFGESRDVAAPNATVPVHSLLPAGAELAIDLMLSAKGSGAIVSEIPDNTTAGGNKRGAFAVDLQRGARGAATQVASGGNSLLVATYRCTSSGSQSSNISSDVSVASGQFSGNYGANSCTASQLLAVNISSESCTASGQKSGSLSSVSCTVSGLKARAISSESTVISGMACVALATFSGSLTGLASVSTGGNQVNDRGLSAANVHGGYNSGNQKFELVLSAPTTNATPAQLTSFGLKFSDVLDPAYVYTLGNSMVSTFRILVSARAVESGVGTLAEAGWVIEGVVRRRSGVATTAIVGVVSVTAFKDAALTATDATAVADTTYGCLHVEVTGIAGWDIAWGAVVVTSEV